MSKAYINTFSHHNSPNLPKFEVPHVLVSNACFRCDLKILSCFEWLCRVKTLTYWEISLNRTSQALDLFHVMICQAIRVVAMFFYISRIWRLGDQPMIPGRAACGLFRSPVAVALCMVWFLSDD